MKNIISPNSKNIPNILFVPIASPSGKIHKQTKDNFDLVAILIQNWVIKNSHKSLPDISFFEEIARNNNYLNASGNDLNYNFNDDSDPEVFAWKKILEGKEFEYSIHFHHDYEMRSKHFYAYITNYLSKNHPIDWQSFINQLNRIKFKPYSGHYDDQSKEQLRNWIPEDGLLQVLVKGNFDEESESSFEKYLVINEIVKKAAYTIELPDGLEPKDYKILLNQMLIGLLDRKTGCYIQ
jgi:hypothetical protein